MVKIVDEQVQRVNALLKPLLQPAPLGRRDDARDDVEREDLFHSSLLAIHVERDPHLHQHALGGRLPPRKFPLRKRLNAVHQVGRAREGYLGIRQELVIEARYLVVGKVHEYKRNSSSASATNCRERKAFSRVGASGGDDGFQPRALFQNPANLHVNGTNNVIAPTASETVQHAQLPLLGQHGQNAATSPAIRTGRCRRETTSAGLAPPGHRRSPSIVSSSFQACFKLPRPSSRLVPAQPPRRKAAPSRLAWAPLPKVRPLP